MTKNEKIITKLISTGLTNKEIAEKLRLSAAIVREHENNIAEKIALSVHVQIAIYKNSGADSLNSSRGKPAKAKTHRTQKAK